MYRIVQVLPAKIKTSRPWTSSSRRVSTPSSTASPRWSQPTKRPRRCTRNQKAQPRSNYCPTPSRTSPQACLSPRSRRPESRRSSWSCSKLGAQADSTSASCQTRKTAQSSASSSQRRKLPTNQRRQGLQTRRILDRRRKMRLSSPQPRKWARRLT